MKNLVIGSEGFVGRSFCQYLETAGETVIRFDIKRGEEEDASKYKLPVEAADRVYFLAWEVGGSKFLYRDEIQFLQLERNLALMTNVFRQLRECPKPFLFVSSQLAEEHDTVYGTTKRLGEVWTRLLNGVRVRLWNIYGSYEPVGERSHVVADFVHQALSTNEIRMLTTGEEQRQFIFHTDVNEGLHQALSDGLQGIYDISSSEWVTVLSIAKIIADQTGAKVVPGNIVGSTPITPMVGKIPGWQPKVSLANGLAQLIAKTKANL